MTYTSCVGCQWENNCEFTCPCDYYCGDSEIDNEIDYAVAKFEMIESYNGIEKDFQ